MKNILEELYDGNIQPGARIYGKDTPFAQAEYFMNRNGQNLTDTLSDAQKEVFEKYCDAHSDMDRIARYDAFTYALKFGILLMTEIFINNSEVVGEITEL